MIAVFNRNSFFRRGNFRRPPEATQTHSWKVFCQMVKPLLCRRLGHATLLIATLLTYGAATSHFASAGVIGTFAQVGPDVTVTFSGSIDSAGNSTTSIIGGPACVDGGNGVNRLFF
jgi:hypothetical protein